MAKVESRLVFPGSTGRDVFMRRAKKISLGLKPQLLGVFLHSRRRKSNSSQLPLHCSRSVFTFLTSLSARPFPAEWYALAVRPVVPRFSRKV